MQPAQNILPFSTQNTTLQLHQATITKTHNHHYTITPAINAQTSAKKATSCLQHPQENDTVIIAQTQQQLWIIQILETQAPETTLQTQGNLNLISTTGNITLHAKTTTQIQSQTLQLQHQNTHLNTQNLQIQSQRLQAYLKHSHIFAKKVIQTITSLIHKGNDEQRQVSRYQLNSHYHTETCEGLKHSQAKIASQQAEHISLAAKKIMMN